MERRIQYLESGVEQAKFDGTTRVKHTPKISKSSPVVSSPPEWSVSLLIPAILTTALEVSLLTIYVLAICVVSTTAIRGVRTLPPLGAGRPGSTERMVSIILPVKDEADTLREALGSLVSLDYPRKEIIVVRGDSTDGTDEILQEFGSEVKVIAEGSRPEGWRGKCWACWLGFLGSKGDVLLFTDGDVVHRENSLSSSLARMESDKASLVSVWPEVMTRAKSERTLYPVGAFFLSAGIASRATKRTPSGTIVRGANGQYMLISREAYVSVGGHAGVRGNIIEDGALGRRFVDSGHTVWNLDGRGFARVKPYANFREIWIAFERFSAGLLSEFRSLLSVEILSFLYFVFPILLILIGVVTRSTPSVVAGVSAVAVAYGTSTVFYRKHSHAVYALLTPVAGVIMIAAFARGFVRFRREGVEWKGRLYRKEGDTGRTSERSE